MSNDGGGGASGPDAETVAAFWKSGSVPLSEVTVVAEYRKCD